MGNSIQKDGHSHTHDIVPAQPSCGSAVQCSPCSHYPSKWRRLLPVCHILWSKATALLSCYRTAGHCTSGWSSKILFSCSCSCPCSVSQNLSACSASGLHACSASGLQAYPASQNCSAYSTGKNLSTCSKVSIRSASGLPACSTSKNCQLSADLQI